jgi:hypothetical protein
MIFGFIIACALQTGSSIKEIMQGRGAIKEPSAMNPDVNHMLPFNSGRRVDGRKSIFGGKKHPSFDYMPAFRGAGREYDQKERDLENGKPGFHRHRRV